MPETSGWDGFGVSYKGGVTTETTMGGQERMCVAQKTLLFYPSVLRVDLSDWPGGVGVLSYMGVLDGILVRF